MPTIATQTDTQEIHILYITRPVIYGSDIVGLFSDYEKAINAKDEIVQHFICKGDHIGYMIYIQTVGYTDFDKVHDNYSKIIKDFKFKSNFEDHKPSSEGLWNGWLALKMKEYNNKANSSVDIVEENCKATQSAYTGIYIVGDFHSKEMSKSDIVGVFTNPQLAQQAQESVLLSYCLSLDNTYDDKHLVDLVGFPDIADIDKEVVKYRYAW